jgi:hypothetical protein
VGNGDSSITSSRSGAPSPRSISSSSSLGPRTLSPPREPFSSPYSAFLCRLLTLRPFFFFLLLSFSTWLGLMMGALVVRCCSVASLGLWWPASSPDELRRPSSAPARRWLRPAASALLSLRPFAIVFFSVLDWGLPTFFAYFGACCVTNGVHRFNCG